MVANSSHGRRSRVLARWCVLVSLGLAAIAWFTLLAALLIHSSSKEDRSSLRLLLIVWPVYYAFVFGGAYLIALAGRRGTLSEQWPARLQAAVPTRLRVIIDVAYSMLANIVLLLFPMVAALMAVLVLWAVATGQSPFAP
jgi:hypothetical protein